METLSPYSVVSNSDGTFVVSNNETGQLLSTHLRLDRASRSAERLNKRDRRVRAALGSDRPV